MILVALFEWFFTATLLTTLLLLTCFKTAANRLPHVAMLRSINTIAKYRLALFVVIGCVLYFLQYTLPVNWIYVLYGVFDQLSVTSLVALCMLFCARILNRQIVQPSSIRILLWAACITGTAFYPFALGFGQFNPYNLGFASSIMLFNCVLLACVCIACRYWLGFYILLLALSMQMLHVHESTNLWDYIIDATVYLYSLYYCSKQLVCYVLGRTKRVPAM